MHILKRALLGSFVVAGGLFAMVSQLKCQAEPFKFYNRLICPQCLTATVDGQIEYGNNIDHYSHFKVIDWQGIMPDMRVILVDGEDELTFATIACLREFGFRGEIEYLSQTLPYRRRELMKRLRDHPESLMIRPRGFYNNYKVNLKRMAKPIEEDVQFPTPKFRLGHFFGSTTVVPYTTPLPSEGETSRIHKLDNLHDFIRLQKGLETAKSVHVVGGTPESIELYYQLKQQFPQLKVSFSYDNLSKELRDYAPSDSYAGYSFNGVAHDGVTLSKASETRRISGDLVIFMHKFSEPRQTTPLNGFERGYKMGNIMKRHPNNELYSTNSLENVHNIVMNVLDKRTAFFYPSVEAYKFGQDKPVFLLGNFENYDQKLQQNGVSMYFKNGILIGARGQDPRAISILRQAIAVDCIPIYKGMSELSNHKILQEVAEALDKAGVRNRLKTQLPRQPVQIR